MGIDDPKLLLIGLLMTIVGVLIIRWSSRFDASREIAQSTKTAAIDVLSGAAKTKEARERASERVAASSRRDFARFVGVLGFLILIAGLIAVALGVFGTP